MSLWESIMGIVGGKSAGGSTAKSCVIDGERLMDGRGGGPVERVQVLQRLAQFSEREQLKCQVVFAGRPLREVAHGGDFGPLKVYFAEQASGISEQVESLARSGAGRQSVVVTSDKELEDRLVGRGAQVMRTSTLRKAMDPSNLGGGEGGSMGRRDHGGRRGGRDRGGRDRRDRRDGPPSQQQQDQRPRRDESSQSDQTNSGSEPSVKNLIDLVE